MNKLYYLASPFSDPLEVVRYQRYNDAALATAMFLKRDIMVYSPIVHNYHVARMHHMRSDFEFWQRFDLEMINRCDALIVLTIPGWEKSTGVVAEINHARSLGKMSYYVALLEIPTFKEENEQVSGTTTTE